MKAYAELTVKAPKEAIWAVICDIDHCDQNIGGIQKVEVLEKPAIGMVGLKWRETRTMFGKEATEVMWVTEAEENSYYQTRAESHGSIYSSRMAIEDKGDHCLLSMAFNGEAVSMGAKIGDVIFSRMMTKSTEKALLVDLEDIRAAVVRG